MLLFGQDMVGYAVPVLIPHGMFVKVLKDEQVANAVRGGGWWNWLSGLRGRCWGNEGKRLGL